MPRKIGKPVIRSRRPASLYRTRDGEAVYEFELPAAAGFTSISGLLRLCREISGRAWVSVEKVDDAEQLQVIGPRQDPDVRRPLAIAGTAPTALHEPTCSVSLPHVAGDVCLRPLADFGRACEVHIDEEQRRPNPDNALIALLCDGVRLSREFAHVGVSPNPQGRYYGEPLEASVEDGRVVVGIGVQTLAHATALADWANPFDESADDDIRTFAIEDAPQFAKDVVSAMLSEREDGSTPLSDFLDRMAQTAIEDGSLGLHEDHQHITHGTFAPCETWAVRSQETK